MLIVCRSLKKPLSGIFVFCVCWQNIRHAVSTSATSCDYKSLNVTINLVLATILSIDDSEQKIKAKVSLHMYWKDASLAWNASGADGLAVKYRATEDVCFPDIVLDESLETFVMPPSDVNLDVSIRHNGEVVIYYPFTYTGFCSLQMANYPFDKQTCYLSFWSTLRTIEELDLWPQNFNPTYKSYKANAEFELLFVKVTRLNYTSDTPTFAGQQFVTLTYEIHVQRKPLFYILNLLLPSTLVAVISTLGFFTSSESSEIRTEKITLGITTLLSMAILLLTVSTKLPVTSDVVPLLTQYYTVLIVLITFGNAFSTVYMMAHYQGEQYNKSMPKWLKNLALKMSRVVGMEYMIDKQIFQKVVTRVKVAPSEIQDDSNMDNNTGEHKDTPTNGVMHRREHSSRKLQSGDALTDRRMKKTGKLEEPSFHFLLGQKLDSDLNKYEWRAVTTILDRFCLIFFLLCYTLTIIFFSAYGLGLYFA